MRSVLAFSLSITTVLLSGCGGSGVERTDIKGTATFDGKPIVYGNIQFFPDTSKGNEGPSGSTSILDGKFDTSLEGSQGITPGPNRVQITAYAEMPPEGGEDETAVEDVVVEPLFLEYVLEIDIQGTEIALEIPAEAEGYNPYAEEAIRQANEP